VTDQTPPRGAVNLNLFPFSEDGPLRICVTFVLADSDKDTKKSENGELPVWWR
jgi:hypothetical protein